jgi:transcriptional regulator of acetoin/glycerol metabolism
MSAVEITACPIMSFVEKKAKGHDQNAGRHNLQAALAFHKGNSTLTVKHLGIRRITLWKKLKEFGID